MESHISSVCLFIFLITLSFGDFLHKRLDKPGYIMVIRLLCWTASVASLFFLAITLLRSSRLVDDLIYHASISFWEIFRIVIRWLMVVFMAMGFWKYWLYYIRHDKKTILTAWHVRKQMLLCEDQQYDEAYRHLQAASEISPRSIPIWCALACLCEYYLKSPDKCDQYLAKAGQVISDNPVEKDIAVLEHYTGGILWYRGELQSALEHLQKAYDLTPTPIIKETLDTVLKKIHESQDKTNT